VSKPLYEALPVAEPLPEALPADAPRPRRGPGPLRRMLSFLGRWTWRLLWGTIFGTNWVLGIALLGWLQRWTRRRVLLAWWRASPKAATGGFDTFYEGWLAPGPDAPAPPRFFLREGLRRFRHVVERPADGRRPLPLTQARRVLVTPIHSLLLNLWVGLRTLFCTSLVLGPGCLLILFGWEFGWLNSFNKGYEQAAVGPLTSFLGIALFIAGMFYVPLAQVHVAVANRGRAFFDFRFVRRLARARPLGCLFLAVGMTALGWLLEVLKSAPAFFPWGDLPENATQADYQTLLQNLRNYYLFCSFALFVALILTRVYAARLYRTALHAALRKGDLTRADLPPELLPWFDRLGVLPAPERRKEGFERFLRESLGGGWRFAVGVALALTWFAFVAKAYVGEFLNAHPAVGFLNQPLVLLPTFDHIPGHLEKDARGEGETPGGGEKPPPRPAEGE
jgi:hypothetical protein